MRLEGSLTVLSSGNNKTRPMTSDCSPNEVSVVQLRRVLRFDELSSRLSANIVSSSMASSREKIGLLIWTPCSEQKKKSANEKRPHFHAACWYFIDTRGVRFSYCGVVGLGVV